MGIALSKARPSAASAVKFKGQEVKGQGHAWHNISA